MLGDDRPEPLERQLERDLLHRHRQAVVAELDQDRAERGVLQHHVVVEEGVRCRDVLAALRRGEAAGEREHAVGTDLPDARRSVARRM